MEELTVRVPSERLDFFKELLKELDIEVAQQIEIPEEHKNIVRERIKRSEQNPERLLNWEEVRNQFTFKS